MGTGRKSILIVEDEPGIRRLIAETLSDAGFECLVARDGEEGFQKASTADVGAAVLDLNLPGISGAELAWRLKQLVPDAHLVAVSANLGEWDAGDLRDLGIATLMSKPCDMDELVSVLVELLSMSGDDAGRESPRGRANGSPDCGHR